MTSPAIPPEGKRLIELGALISDLELLDGPSREMDARIAVAVNWELPAPMGSCKASLKLPMKWDHCEPGTYWLAQRSGSSLRTAPLFTASIDAAVALAERVLSKRKFWWTIQDHGGACIYRYEHRADEFLEFECIDASNPAIALVVATLRAKAEEKG